MGTTALAPSNDVPVISRRVASASSGMSVATTRTGRPAARRSAWTIPQSGWRGSSGSTHTVTDDPSGGSAVSRLATTATSSHTSRSDASG